jgi:hypothetical protein
MYTALTGTKTVATVIAIRVRGCNECALFKNALAKWAKAFFCSLFDDLQKCF